MARNKNETNEKEIRINGSSNLHDLVWRVSKNYGITISQYLKPKIRAILDAEPAHMKREPSEE